MRTDELHRLKTLRELLVQMRAFILTKEHAGFFFTCKRLQEMADYLAAQAESPTERYEDIIRDMGSAYKALFSPRDGLSEFYIWHDNYDRRKKANDAWKKVRADIEQLLYPETGMFWSGKHLHGADM